jgi:hypothetical protein
MLDETHAALDEPPRHEALAAEHLGRRLVGAVELVGGGAFLGEVEGFGCFPLHAEGEFKGSDACVQLAVDETPAFVDVVEPLQRVELHPLRAGRGGGIAEVGDGIFQIADERALIRAGEKAGRPELGALEHGGGTDDDEAGQVLIHRAEAIREPRPKARPREGLLAGAHLEGRAAVVDVVGDHRADDADVVDARRGLGQEFAYRRAGLAVLGKLPRRGEDVPGLHTLEFGRLERQRLAVVLEQPRLRVEEIDMRWTAGHVEKDDTLCLGRMMRRTNGKGLRGAIGFRREQIGKRQQAESGAGTAQPFAARVEAGAEDFFSQHR